MTNPTYDMVHILSPKEQEHYKQWFSNKCKEASKQRKKRNVPDGKENEK